MRSTQMVPFYRIDTLHSRTYIVVLLVPPTVNRSSLQSQWILVQSEDIPRASSTNSTRVWTREVVGGVAKQGPPQLPSRPKSIIFRWRSMDQRRCTHTPIHTLVHTPGKKEKMKLNKGTLLATVQEKFSRAPAHSSPWGTERRRRFAPTSALHY